jgi:hypothetical protein
MNDNFTPETLREKAEFVTGIIGADGKTTDAIVRLGVQMRAGAVNQADFDAVQDAFDDAAGRPHRKHMHLAAWKISYWWHWHVTSPIVYPLLDVPAKIGMVARKVSGRKLTWMRIDTEGYLHMEEMTWYEARRVRRSRAGGQK